MDKQYSIREVSAKFNLPASTLRYYEEVGILTDIPRNSSGKRIYLEKHINRVMYSHHFLYRLEVGASCSIQLLL